MLSTLKFIADHPLNRKNKPAAIARFAAWQIGSRLKAEHTHNWIGDTKLVVRNGMTGATGNIYCGLHEFADMAFVLHFLRESDTFADVGANIGSYTVLASGVSGAKSIAFEPDPGTAGHLRRNIAVNDLENKVSVIEKAVGDREGEISFTVGLDTVNKVAEGAAAGGETRTVPVTRLDDAPALFDASLMKLDVEGFEETVLKGAEKLLQSQKLIAIETEAQDAAIAAILEAAGFVRYWYDPVARTLQDGPVEGLKSSNALYLRDVETVRERVKSARQLTVNGVTF